jgi:osmotically-inducible protein OsmY
MIKRIGRAFAGVAAGAVLASLALSGCGKASESTPSSMGSAASTVMGNVSDVDVTEHVKTALQSDEALKGFNITVVTLKGDVRLTGTLDSQVQKDQAIAIAKRAEGAHAIHDELLVRQ